MEEIMSELAAVGPFFTADPQAPAEGDAGPGGFRPLSELYGAGLGGYVAEVGRRIGTGPDRVAASTAQLGIASRLWSLALGAAALGGRVPDLAPDRVRWRLPRGGSLQLALPAPRAVPGPAAAGFDALIEGNLRVLDASVRAGYGLSPKVLRGNSASALVGALRVLTGRLPRTPYPPVPLVAALLEAGPLAGSGTFVHEEGLGFAFVRNSCCLYYRVEGAGLCGDCVLRTKRKA
ncbi:(2Fe-2S)-binding protein [Streptomyces sp. NBC_00239]|uniref:(2Fe-2S)-binding protein n=1 Tax=Streptomyces sp. NBC_00239 TaxID=2903640 RepID=UPI002E2B1179|nr:(2Fe-2S)-binding protein [Streptomyces sp. NBC_00239]